MRGLVEFCGFSDCFSITVNPSQPPGFVAQCSRMWRTLLNRVFHISRGDWWILKLFPDCRRGVTASGIFDYNNRLICLSPRRIKGGRSKCVSRHFRRPDQFELNELSFVMQTTAPSEYITGSKQSITLKLLKYFFFLWLRSCDVFDWWGTKKSFIFKLFCWIIFIC